MKQTFNNYLKKHNTFIRLFFTLLGISSLILYIVASQITNEHSHNIKEVTLIVIATSIVMTAIALCTIVNISKGSTLDNFFNKVGNTSKKKITALLAYTLKINIVALILAIPATPHLNDKPFFPIYIIQIPLALSLSATITTGFILYNRIKSNLEYLNDMDL